MSLPVAKTVGLTAASGSVVKKCSWGTCQEKATQLLEWVRDADATPPTYDRANYCAGHAIEALQNGARKAPMPLKVKVA